jgi:hypothetical protein
MFLLEGSSEEKEPQIDLYLTNNMQLPKAEVNMRARLNMVACPRTLTSNLYHYCQQLFSHIDTRNQARTQTTTVITGCYFDQYDASVDYRLEQR